MFRQSYSLFLVNQWLSLYGIYRATLSFLVSLCSVIHSNSRLVKLVGSSSIEQGFELCRKATESQFLHLSLYLLSWWLDSVFVSSIASWHSLQLIGVGWFVSTPYVVFPFSHTHGRPNENLRITACYNGSCKPKCSCWLF